MARAMSGNLKEMQSKGLNKYSKDSTIRMEDLSAGILRAEGTLNASCNHLDLAKDVDHQFRIWSAKGARMKWKGR